MTLTLAVVVATSLSALPARAQTAPYGPRCPDVAVVEVPGGTSVTVRSRPDLPPPPNSTVVIRLDGAAIATVQTDAAGQYLYRFDSPGTAADSHVVEAPCSEVILGEVVLGEACDFVGVATLQGGTFAVVRSVEAFSPNDIVRITLDGAPFAAVRTDAKGNYTYRFTVPGGIAERHVIETPCAEVRAELPPTGLATAEPLVRAAAALLATGFGLVAVTARRRRRRRQHQRPATPQRLPRDP